VRKDDERGIRKKHSGNQSVDENVEESWGVKQRKKDSAAEKMYTKKVKSAKKAQREKN